MIGAFVRDSEAVQEVLAAVAAQPGYFGAPNGLPAFTKTPNCSLTGHVPGTDALTQLIAIDAPRS
jgi:hypothetical protein